MELAAPTMLLWALLAVPVVALYLLRATPRRLPVATTMFWQQIIGEKQHRSLWWRLRYLYSLLLQLLVLLLLVAALAEPFFIWEVQQGRRIVLVLDNSASMNAPDTAGTRWAQAKAEAARFLEGLRHRDEAALMTAGTEAKLICGFTNHRRTLLELLETLPPTEGATCVPQAIGQARRLLTGASNHQIVVFTDGGFSEAGPLLSAVDVRTVLVGQTIGNLGITRFQTRRSVSDPAAYEILVEVTNSHEGAAEGRLSIDRDNIPVDEIPLRLEGKSTWTRVVDASGAEGGVLHAKLETTGTFTADKQAWAILPARQALPVLLVTESKQIGDLYLEKVLEASPLIRQPPQVMRLAQAPVPSPGMVAIFHLQVPGKLPNGPLLVLHPQQSSELWEVGEKIVDPLVSQQEKDTLLLSHVKLEGLTLPAARRLTPKHPHTQTLATAVSGEPVLLAIDRPEGRVLVLTGDLEQGDLPLRTAFPILMSNALAWLTGQGDDLQEAVATGSTVEVTLPTSASGLKLWAPDGRALPLAQGVERLTVGPFDQCGLWRIAAEPQGQPVKVIAVNLGSSRESDLSVPHLEGIHPPEQSRWLLRPVWYYLLVLVILLGIVEWYLYQRRWIQ
jgi:hypothetical protein